MSWVNFNVSVRGHGHVSKGLPCQDAAMFYQGPDGYNILALADGAGLMLYAKEAAEFIVKQACIEFSSILELVSLEDLTNEHHWKSISFETFYLLHKKLAEYANMSNMDFNEMGSTLIVCIYKENLLLTAHLGDGRAGFMNAENQWKASMMPYSGDEVATTVFMNLPVWDDMTYFESTVIVEAIKAVTIISDGCECLCWNTTRKIQDDLYASVNEPFAPFYNAVLANIKTLLLSKSKLEIEQMLCGFFHDGHPAFVNERDDKTMLLSFINV